MIELCCEYLSVRCIWLYVIIISRTSFRVNPHSIVCLNVKDLLAQSRCEIWSISDSNGIRTHNHWFSKRTLNHLAKLAKWLSCAVSTYLYSAFDSMLLLCQVRVSEYSEYYHEFQLHVRVSEYYHVTYFRCGACFKQGVPWHSGRRSSVDSLWN